jgi:hypothetical protein
MFQEDLRSFLSHPQPFPKARSVKLGIGGRNLAIVVVLANLNVHDSQRESASRQAAYHDEFPAAVGAGSSQPQTLHAAQHKLLAR